MEEQLRVSGESQGCNNAFGTKVPEKQHIRCKHAREIKVLFGQPFRGYHGTEAINKLKNERRGYIPSAFHRDDIGNIDLIYGNDCIGLKHIIKERIGRGEYRGVLTQNI